MEDLLAGISWWHWLVLGLVLFGIEMLTGTFDLLMASIAAALTSVLAFALPQLIGGWEMQVIVFTLASVLLIFVSRVLFPSLRQASPEHPTLNKRMAGLVGQRGEVTRELSSGHGQVQIGDTVWGAEPAEGEGPLNVGDVIVVTSTRANMAIVRKA